MNEGELTWMLTYTTNQFQYDKPDKTFYAEASTIGLNSMPTHGDICLNLISARTGENSAWYLHITRKNDDEILLWDLCPTELTIKKHPRLAEHHIVIYND